MKAADNARLKKSVKPRKSRPRTLMAALSPRLTTKHSRIAPFGKLSSFLFLVLGTTHCGDGASDGASRASVSAGYYASAAPLAEIGVSYTEDGAGFGLAGAVLTSYVAKVQGGIRCFGDLYDSRVRPRGSGREELGRACADGLAGLEILARVCGAGRRSVHRDHQHRPIPRKR
jgi:hypothetical protein